MKISVLGTGMVGHALATKLAALGHDVMMGARDSNNEKASAWAAANGATSGSFKEAAEFAEVVFLATLGSATLDAAEMAGKENLSGKIVVDVTNPLDLSAGFPPTLMDDLVNKSSLGEALQTAFPDAKVVKALNTMNCDVMVDPGRVPGEHDVFLCGNDDGAKNAVVGILNQMGWKDPIDLGPIEAARGTEGMMNFWLRLYGVVGHSDFNYRIVKADKSS